MKTDVSILSVRPLTAPLAAAAIFLSIFFSFAIPQTQAASLTEPQIQAILSLLSSFGTDQATISNVEVALRGGSTPATQSPTITVTASTTTLFPASTITTCQKVTTSGTYTLSSDISSSNPNEACIDIRDTSNITLDCNFHSITGNGSFGALFMYDVHGFTIKNCTLNSQNAPGFTIVNSDTGNLVGNTIRAPGDVNTSTGLTISGNTFLAPYSQSMTSASTISNNTFNTPYSAIVSAGGSNNKILNNTIDGKSNGVFVWQTGADDGIILGSNTTPESDDLVSGNVISNMYDCGIETSGIITNTVIENNDITNTGYCGIGAWYNSSWKGNTVRNNTVKRSPMLFVFQLNWVQDFSNTIYFKDNNFTGNKLIDAKTNVFPQSSIFNVRSGSQLPSGVQLVLNNNVIKGNDFSASSPLLLYPFSMIVDGGGNTCKSSGETIFPLKCAGDGAAGTGTTGTGTNGTGTTGTVISQSVNVTLTQVDNNYYLYSGPATQTGPAIRLNGAPVAVGQLSGWVPVAAVLMNGTYDVGWKHPNGMYTIWTLDANGNYTTGIGEAARTDPRIYSFESTAGYDLNGDGTIGAPMAPAPTEPSPAPAGTVISRSINVTLTQVDNNYYLYSGPATQTGPAIRLNGAPVAVGQLSGWTPIAAVHVNDTYSVGWKHPNGNYTIWTLDVNGNYTTSIGEVVGTDSRIYGFESAAGYDLNGDGTIGAPRTSAQSGGSNFQNTNLAGAPQSSPNYAGMVAAAAMVPFNILVDALTDLFVSLGVGR